MSSLFKVVEESGRLRVPRSILEECGIEKGNVVKVSTVKNGILIYKVGVVDNNDATPKEAESLVMNTLHSLEKNDQLDLLQKIVESIRRE